MSGASRWCLYRSLVCGVCAAGLATPLAAQHPMNLDASLGATGSAWQASVSAGMPLLGGTGRIRAGAGVRLSAFGGDPATYTNRGTVQGGLVAGLGIDPAVFALNAAVFADVRLARGLTLGANLDLAGVAAGPRRTMGALRAKPQTASYFGYGSNDHGALNSEFFASVRLAPRLRLRAGLSHYVTNYVVTDAAATGAPSHRYQRFETVPFIALGLQR
jgi:hypothetical protein